MWIILKINAKNSPSGNHREGVKGSTDDCESNESLHFKVPAFDMADVNMTINGEEGIDTLLAAEGHDILNCGAVMMFYLVKQLQMS